MASQEISVSSPGATDRTGRILNWVVTILAGAYCLWIGTSLYQSTAAFDNMYKSMGVELNVPARFVTTAYRWLYPILFGGAAAVVIAKQFFVREKWANVAFTVAVTFAVQFASSGIVRALYSPLFEMIEKLK